LKIGAKYNCSKNPCRNFAGIQGSQGITKTLCDIYHSFEACACGGMDYVATLISELAEKINADKLIALMEKNQQLTWLQRLGYLFDFLEQHHLSKAVKKSIEEKRLQPCLLEPNRALSKGIKNKKWNIWVNIDSEVFV
jgi:predicted transcriptional regulator of viral defense system